MRIHARRLLTPGGWRADQTVEIQRGRITAITDAAGDRTVDVLAPGFFDTHTHGGLGFCLSSRSFGGLEAYLVRQLASGVTDLLLTPSTAPAETLVQSLAFAREAMDRQARGALKGARIRGVHMEGPVLSPARPGAMNPSRMLPADPDAFEGIFGAFLDIVRLVTIAPELPGAFELAAFLRARGICVQAGHTDATYEQAEAAFGMGFDSLCHTFNACRPIHHRDPAVVTAALLNENVYCEAICDLVHLHPAAIRLIYKNKGVDRMIVVSDTTQPAGLPDGEYTANGRTYVLKNGAIRTEGGALSGAMNYIDQGVRNLIALGIPDADACYMASRTPARRMGLLGIGAIVPGASAHLTALSAAFVPQFSVLGDEIHEA